MGLASVLNISAGGSAAPAQRAREQLSRADAKDPATARNTAAKLATELFFRPMLEEMRRFPFGRDLADGGRTEAIFADQLNTRLADSIAGSDPGGFITQLAAQISRPLRAEAAPAGPGAAAATWPAAVQAGRAEPPKTGTE